MNFKKIFFTTDETYVEEYHDIQVVSLPPAQEDVPSEHELDPPEYCY